ncbi:MAG: Zn-dependent hydrolase [Leptolyngbyaceae cyanobacterium SM1_1_3]|nr:Zn-dependent hydrolase [Leptolyngbyaceae cyanobacterium SM1_1_3]NJN02926.1 Zn-dependent hydrolase [Leptolyngbyaceae cyanobacterium RM1_1_2]NJO08872.1 Zn-dependent hydrolase [Leptolyngbyaceae cyanobacterium SL_1_1]
MTVQLLPVVNCDRLYQSLMDLADIGKLPGSGVRRLAFSPEDIRARQLVWRWMAAAGLSVRSDAAGNIIGMLPGKQAAPAFATGSHIDTVPKAGKYDGTLGVLAGIEVARTLKENGLQLQHPFEVIVFTDEEDSMIGSKAIAGTILPAAEQYDRKNQPPIQSRLQQIGGDWSQIASARRSRADMCAFVELHVEQGQVLETSGKSIGVVEGVVGLQRYMMTIKGAPNHAGTTPMELRQDALVAASHVVLAVESLAKTRPGQQVATVGALTVWPNATNVIPGEVRASLDVRDLSKAEVTGLVEQLKTQLGQIAAATQTKILIEPVLDVDPSPAAPRIQQTITAVCDRLGFSHLSLPSRAGHDAQEMGRFTDMGMIFVPSEGGVSHSEIEYTSPEQCAQGATVLLQTLLELDRGYST